MDDMFENEEMQEILHDFIVETSEILESVDQQLIQLENDPDNLDLLNEIFRGVHTIKGASGFLGLKQIVEVAHKSEEVLNKYRQGTLKVTPTGMDALLNAVDMLRVLMDHVKAKEDTEEDIDGIIAALKEAEISVAAEAAPPAAEAAPPVVEAAPPAAEAAPPVVEAAPPAPVAPPEDNMFANEEMQEIFHDFIVETTEILESVDQQLVVLENDPENLDLLNEIFRGVHTIKGASGFLGLKQIVEVAHKSEEVLNKYRQGTLKVTPTGMDALLSATDMLKTLMDHVRAKDSTEEDIIGVIAALMIAENDPVAMVDPGAAAVPAPAAAPEVAVAPEIAATPEVATPPAPTAAPEVAAAKPKAKAKGDLKIRKEDIDTIRVDTTRLDSVMNMVGELVLGRNRLARIASRLEDRHPEDDLVVDLLQNSAHLNSITTDLQVAVMKTRMQQIVKVFGRFPRMVRDLARDKGKDVNLVLVGQETELDKTVIEEIGDPLVHLVRNSVDHGIESPEERTKVGKPRTGTLTLSAYHKGNNIYVTIEDDGKGIDTEAVKKKALEKGVVTREELDRMGQKEILNLIFLPGFSTAKVVSDTSGRGVGMDVVKTNITKLNGSIDIESTPGVGSKMILRLPLTLAIIHALMCGVGDDEYALPLSSVVEILKVEDTEISTVEGRETLYFRDKVYSLIRLGKMVGTVGTGKDDYAVLMSHGDKVFGLMVEQLIGQEEVVIKSLGEYLANTKGVSGATITGDGRVVLIVDVMGLYASI